MISNTDPSENRDYFGNYVYNPNADTKTKIEQALKYGSPTPFSVSNFERGKQMGEPKTAWLSAFGFPRSPAELNFTPAEKWAFETVKSREPPHTPEEMEEWRQKREAFKNGTLSHSEARRFVKEQRETFLQREFKKLKYSEAVPGYNAANEHERQSLDRLMREKRSNAIHRHGRAAGASQ